MQSQKTPTYHTVSDRDFLIGSVWEGTGEEIHVSRHFASQSEFGGRILSGISGMLVTIASFDAGLLRKCPSRLEWAFNGAILEEDRIEVTGTGDEDRFAIEGRAGRAMTDRPTSAGTIEFGELQNVGIVVGTSTRGRTFTPADIELYRSWLGPKEGSPDSLVPWPLIVLLASGLVSRSGYLGAHEMTLNRGYKWTFAALPEVGDTLHCIYGPIQKRVSSTRPDLTVGRYDVAVVSSVTGQTFAKIDWTVMFR